MPHKMPTNMPLSLKALCLAKIQAQNNMPANMPANMPSKNIQHAKARSETPFWHVDHNYHRDRIRQFFDPTDESPFYPAGTEWLL